MTTIDRCLEEMRRLGWSVGHCCLATLQGSVWLVDASRPPHRIEARAPTLEEAYEAARDITRRLTE